MLKFFICYILIITPFLVHAQNWMQLGLGAYNGVYRLYADTTNNLLYASGDFRTTANDTIKGIAKWNGTTWDSLGSGLNSSPTAIAFYNGELYTGGGFTQAGTISANHIARWNGVNWDSLPSNNIDNYIFALYEYNSELYVSGMFSYVGTTTSRSIAKWNETSWGTVGSPPWALVIAESMKEYNGELYVGGSFDAPSRHILKWSGNNWFDVNPSVIIQQLSSGYPPIQAMEVFQNKLYIAGDFFLPYENIISWDDTNYLPVGGGVDGVIFDMAIFNSELYVVGDFNTAGGVVARNIAKWDGVKWCGLGSTFNGVIKSVQVFNNELYIGGTFTLIDGVSISGVAKWIGGSYVDTCDVVGVNELQESNFFSIYPNPNNGSFTIDIENLNEANLVIYNLSGQIVLQKKLTQNLTSIDLTMFSKGMYFVKVNTEKGIVIKKIVYH
jgi:hypothetical protein